MKRIWYIKKIFILLILLIGIYSLFPLSTVNAQYIPIKTGGNIRHYGSNDYVTVNDKYIMKDTEFRAVWVSPLVSDIAYYSTKEQYQKQMVDVLDTMEEYNLNVLVFHIRIMNDAFYPSKYCNWSKYYNTNPDWECLPWLIEECHRRGIEFHAWMNPYRVSNGTHDLQTLASQFPVTNAAFDKDNLLQGKNSVILNPGEPAVKDFLINVCMEVVENYDVDAIHFDDYFYDNGVDDSLTRKKYNSKNLSLGDFRRAQVNEFIERLSNSLREYNKANNRRVQLGISPSGVYRADTNKNNGFGTVDYDPVTKMVSSEGSRTASASFQHYDNYLYSDTLYWINKEWIDYIIPQTYWALNNGSCPYADLMEWWDEVCSYKNVNLYSGLGIYRNNDGGDSWTSDPKECYWELMVCNSLDNCQGVCFFKYTNILEAVRNPKVTEGVNEIWTNKPILPEIKTMEPLKVDKVNNLEVFKTDKGYKLSFSKDEKAKFYVIYRSDKEITEYKPELVIDIIGDLSNGNVLEFLDCNSDTSKNYYYAVREQSYSLTLGEGSVVNTNGCEEGSILDLGEIKDLKINGELLSGKKITILFGSFYYPYGGNIKYLLEYSFDGQVKSQATTFYNKYNYKCFDVDVPNGAKQIEVKLTISNDIGQTSKTITKDALNSLGDITNFYMQEPLYTNKLNSIMWNNLKDPNITYIFERSKNNVDWEEVKILTSKDYNIDEINIKNKVRFDSTTGVQFFRVKAITDNAIGYSNVIKTNVSGYLGDFTNLTVNGRSLRNSYLVQEDDKIIIRFKAIRINGGYANYLVTYSSNFNDWLSINLYDRTINQYLSSDGYYNIEIPVNYSCFKFYVKIEGISDKANNVSEYITFYAQIYDIFHDELIEYLKQQNTAFLNAMDIYK